MYFDHPVSNEALNAVKDILIVIQNYLDTITFALMIFSEICMPQVIKLFLKPSKKRFKIYCLKFIEFRLSLFGNIFLTMVEK